MTRFELRFLTVPFVALCFLTGTHTPILGDARDWRRLEGAELRLVVVLNLLVLVVAVGGSWYAHRKGKFLGLSKWMCLVGAVLAYSAGAIFQTWATAN